jgi:3-oxoacyl-[acyl-carrier-protein] synthase II
MVLEEYEHAKARGAKIYAELSGYGMSADAGHMTAPNMDGPRRAMVNALKNAGVNTDQVDYLNAHGTGTESNDGNEARAIHEVFGDHAARLAVGSTKAMHGHTLGAAGAIEAAATVLAIHHGIIPPTPGCLPLDPGITLEVVAEAAFSREIRAALSNSFAFGGLNAVLAFRRM